MSTARSVRCTCRVVVDTPRCCSYAEMLEGHRKLRSLDKSKPIHLQVFLGVNWIHVQVVLRVNCVKHVDF